MKNVVLIIIAICGLSFNSCNEEELSPQEILNQIELTPDPFKDSFNIIIHGQVVGEFEYTIYDRWGSTIVNESFDVRSVSNYSHEVTLGQIKDGIYFIVIEFKGVELKRPLRRIV